MNVIQVRVVLCFLFFSPTRFLLVVLHFVFVSFLLFYLCTCLLVLLKACDVFYYVLMC